MTIIEPHIHMYSRTTDDYQRMYAAGIRACVEPSFWLGANRRHPATFFDYFNLILEFETVRATRFGIDHFCAVAMNPKEAEDTALADAVIDGMGGYLDHPRCVAVGEIGLNNITPNEERAFERQIEIARQRDMLVIVHLPHVDKIKGVARTIDIVRNSRIPEAHVIIDHNTEECIAAARKTACYTGMTVYPISKLTPERVSNIIREHGTERMIVNGSADWGISDPLSLVKVADYLRTTGHPEATIKGILFDTPHAFYSQSPKWQPNYDLVPVDPHQFQR